MKHSTPDPAKPFETWLLYRVAEAVESREGSADLLTDLHAAIAETRGRSPDQRHALALMELAERVNLPVDRLTELLATLEAQPTGATPAPVRGGVVGATTGGIRGGPPRR